MSTLRGDLISVVSVMSRVGFGHTCAADLMHVRPALPAGRTASDFEMPAIRSTPLSAVEQAVRCCDLIFDGRARKMAARVDDAAGVLTYVERHTAAMLVRLAAMAGPDAAHELDYSTVGFEVVDESLKRRSISR